MKKVGNKIGSTVQKAQNVGKIATNIWDKGRQFANSGLGQALIRGTEGAIGVLAPEAIPAMMAAEQGIKKLDSLEQGVERSGVLDMGLNQLGRRGAQMAGQAANQHIRSNYAAGNEFMDNVENVGREYQAAGGRRGLKRDYGGGGPTSAPIRRRDFGADFNF